MVTDGESLAGFPSLASRQRGIERDLFEIVVQSGVGKVIERTLKSGGRAVNNHLLVDFQREIAAFFSTEKPHDPVLADASETQTLVQKMHPSGNVKAGSVPIFLSENVANFLREL